MARLGSWDVTACASTWFDVDNLQNGWWDRDLIDCRIVPPPPPPTPTPPRPRPILTRRGGGGGGGISGARRRRPIECLAPPQLYVHFPDPEEEIAPDADYALMVIAEGATVRALANGLVTHFEDARGRLALKLEADDGTNYYYADLSCYVGAADRRVEAGEAIAKSSREAVPEITRAAPTKALPAPGAVAEPPQLRVVAPVFVDPPSTPVFTPVAPPKTLFRLVPITPPAPPKEWAVSAPERPGIPAIVYVAGIGALAALLYVLSRAPKKPKRRKRRR